MRITSSLPLRKQGFLIYTEGTTDTRGYLYNSSRAQLAYNDDNDGINFAIKYSLVKGIHTM